VEDGNTFQENAIIKAKTIMKKLGKDNYSKEYIVIADDSGITVPAINNEPNIYSARYAGIDATDKQNNAKLIKNLKEKHLQKTAAYYTACIAMAYKNNIYTTHGWMWGDVVDREIGANGFGYDPLFIPKGFSKTLGELEYDVKKEFSHRTKALNLVMLLLRKYLSN